jgi:hypothetical protein
LGGRRTLIGRSQHIAALSSANVRAILEHPIQQPPQFRLKAAAIPAQIDDDTPGTRLVERSQHLVHRLAVIKGIKADVETATGQALRLKSRGQEMWHEIVFELDRSCSGSIGTTTNGTLMVQLRDVETMRAQAKAEGWPVAGR